jgi:hypothetical protein
MNKPNGRWFECLPGCEAQVPCGEVMHPVRWEAGALLLPEHPDTEAELVLAALGGDKAGCVTLAEAWGRHADDLSVLAVGPRAPADAIKVGWDDVAAATQSRLAGRPGAHWAGLGGPRTVQAMPRRGPQLAVPPSTPTSPPAIAARQQQMQQELERLQQRRQDMLTLLALGYAFQVRLAGQVAAANADAADGQDAVRAACVRPALVAATAGRLAPVAADWLGIDPDDVAVSLHHGPGWGSAEMDGRRLHVALPADWLATVWACGLALVGRYLVVAVDRAGWPDARVLGLRAPGAQPEPLDVHGRAGEPGHNGAGDIPHWET